MSDPGSSRYRMHELARKIDASTESGIAGAVLKMGAHKIPVWFHEGMLAHPEDQSRVTGGHVDGSFGEWKTKQGAEIHVSLESPWPFETFIHEWVHALFAMRGHPAAYRDDPNEMEWLCDVVANGFTELMARNPELMDGSALAGAQAIYKKRRETCTP